MSNLNARNAGRLALATTPVTSNPMTTNPMTLADLHRRIRADLALPPRRRDDMASALSSVAKALGRPIDIIAADPVALRPLLKGLTPAMVGHAGGRWRNILSLLVAAMRYGGVASVPGRFDHEPSPAWRDLLRCIGAEKAPLFHLGRLARYCTLQGLEPDRVDDTVIARYLNDLTTQSLASEPARCAREAALHWNRAADAHPAWPQHRLTLADNRNIYSLPWSAFPPTMLQDVDRWMGWLGLDPMADRDFRPLRPASLDSNLRGVREYLGALVQQGEDPATFLDLAAVVTPQRAQMVVRFLMARGDGKPSMHTAHMAGLVIALAKNWTKAPDEDLKRYRRMAKNVRPISPGMTHRNRDRLRPLEDPARLATLLDLPQRLCAEVRRMGPPCLPSARQWQTAVAIQTLILIPIRLRNLTMIRISTNLLIAQDGSMTLWFPPEDVKNSSPIEAAVPTELARMLATYIKLYRPLLGVPGSDFLFPGKTATTSKSADGIRTPIKRAIAERCGLAFNPHLFRHMAAMIVLNENPAAHGQAQRILGHKSLNTTVTYYAGMETKGALKHFDGLVNRSRAGAATAGKKRRA